MADKKVATKSYKVKKGASIGSIVEGVSKTFGEGDSIDLTDAQAQAFKDKLDGEVDDEGNLTQMTALESVAPSSKTIPETEAAKAEADGTNAAAKKTTTSSDSKK